MARLSGSCRVGKAANLFNLCPQGRAPHACPNSVFVWYQRHGGVGRRVGAPHVDTHDKRRLVGAASARMTRAATDGKWSLGPHWSGAPLSRERHMGLAEYRLM